MSPQEVLDLCRDLALEIRAEDGNLHVSPAERLPATLRDQLREQKDALVEIPSSAPDRRFSPVLNGLREAAARHERRLTEPHVRRIGTKRKLYNGKSTPRYRRKVTP
jgi:hypothetical protein